MTTHGWMKRIVFGLLGGIVLVGVMGQGCPPPGPSDAPVTIELINLTGNPVDPFLWADPNLLFTPEEVAIPANFVDVGPPLAVGELVTVTLDCFDAGTLLADGDLLLPDGGAIDLDAGLAGELVQVSSELRIVDAPGGGRGRR